MTDPDSADAIAFLANCMGAPAHKLGSPPVVKSTSIMKVRSRSPEATTNREKMLISPDEIFSKHDRFVVGDQMFTAHTAKTARYDNLTLHAEGIRSTERERMLAINVNPDSFLRIDISVERDVMESLSIGSVRPIFMQGTIRIKAEFETRMGEWLDAWVSRAAPVLFSVQPQACQVCDRPRTNLPRQLDATIDVVASILGCHGCGRR